MAFPSRTRRASRSSSIPPPGSNTTNRRHFARPSSTASRWAFMRRPNWCARRALPRRGGARRRCDIKRLGLHARTGLRVPPPSTSRYTRDVGRRVHAVPISRSRRRDRALQAASRDDATTLLLHPRAASWAERRGQRGVIRGSDGSPLITSPPGPPGAVRESDIRAATPSRVWLRTELAPRVLERLADADAFGSLGLTRREALWAAKALGRVGDRRRRSAVVCRRRRRRAAAHRIARTRRRAPAHAARRGSRQRLPLPAPVVARASGAVPARRSRARAASCATRRCAASPTGTRVQDFQAWSPAGSGRARPRAWCS